MCLHSGAQAQQLCRTIAEALSSVLSAAWRSGDQAGVKAAFLPITDISGFSAIASTGTEQQVQVGILHQPFYDPLTCTHATSTSHFLLQCQSLNSHLATPCLLLTHSALLSKLLIAFCRLCSNLHENTRTVCHNL